MKSSVLSQQCRVVRPPDQTVIQSNSIKKIASKLAPLLLEMFNHSLDQGTLPQTLTEANIILLLKHGKNPTDCTSYKPISLLNGDVKILAKLLAMRLDMAMMDIISSDQTGFMRGRHSFSNIRRLIGVVHAPALGETPEVVVSLDAEKAFDQVEWPYLFTVLARFGLGPKFTSWVQLLYTSTKASVVTNRTRSGPFPLSRGTRQGCPLSLLLFVLAIEHFKLCLRLHRTLRVFIENIWNIGCPYMQMTCYSTSRTRYHPSLTL